MTSPLVSVILATHNGSRYLAQSIESVLSQEYNHLELFIIDDASTDMRVSEIIEEYRKKDHRVQTFRNEINKERSWSKNFGVQMSSGTYVAFIDDDDIWQKGKLLRQVEFLEASGSIGLVGTYAQFIDETGALLGETGHLKTTSLEIEKHILMTNQFIHSSVLVRREIFEKSGGFPIDMNLCEDYDLWFRMLGLTGGANIPELLVRYRVRTSSTTAKNIYRMKYYSLLLTWKYRKYFPGFYRAMTMRILLFPFNTVFLLNMWKKLRG